MIIAHRGHSSIYKDNSSLAFLSAIKLQFDMIELDVNICKTGELIIYHDTLLNGLLINDIDLIDLKQYEIITLNEYFNDINCNQIKTYIDVKGNESVMISLINFLNENSNINKELISIATYDMYQFNILVDSKLEVNKGIITCNKPSKTELDLWCINCDFISFSWEFYDNYIYMYLKEKNIKVYLYTCHTAKEYIFIYNNLYNDGIISNIYI